MIALPHNACHPSLLFNEKGHLEAVLGQVCRFCRAPVRQSLTGFICLFSKCPAYLVPIHTVEKLYYVVRQHEKRAII